MNLADQWGFTFDSQMAIDFTTYSWSLPFLHRFQMSAQPGAIALKQRHRELNEAWRVPVNHPPYLGQGCQEVRSSSHCKYCTRSVHNKVLTLFLMDIGSSGIGLLQCNLEVSCQWLLLKIRESMPLKSWNFDLLSGHSKPPNFAGQYDFSGSLLASSSNSR
jgi:hypothetical protein